MHCLGNEFRWCGNQCSDITNTLVGISGETGPVVRISMFIVCTVLPPVRQWFCFRSWCVTPQAKSQEKLRPPSHSDRVNNRFFSTGNCMNSLVSLQSLPSVHRVFVVDVQFVLEQQFLHEQFISDRSCLPQLFLQLFCRVHVSEKKVMSDHWNSEITGGCQCFPRKNIWFC